MERDPVKGNRSQDENDKRQMLLRLITNLRCVECGRLYDAEDFVLVHRRQEVWVLSTRCRHCNEPCHVVISMPKSIKPEPVVDLTPDEIEIASQWQPITADDVLDVHLLLQSVSPLQKGVLLLCHLLWS